MKSGLPDSSTKVSGLEIRPFQPADAVAIIASIAKQPAVENTPPEWLAAKQAKGPAITAWLGGEPIACGGIEIPWNGLAEGWCLFRADTGQKASALAKIAKRSLDHWIRHYQLVRVQAPLRADFQAGIRFAEWLGFKFEGRLNRYHPDGIDALMYALITED